MKLPRIRRRKKKDVAAQQRLASKPRRHIVGKTLLVLLGLVLLILTAYFVNNAIGYMPLVAYLVLLALAFAYPRILVRGLDFGVLVDRDTCLRNTDIALLMRFVNRLPMLCPRIDADFRVTDIFGECDTSTRLSLSLGPKRTRDFEFNVRFGHIGTAQAGITKVTVYDPFGLFYCTVKVDDDTSIEVMPRTYLVDDSLVRSLQLQEAMETATPFSKDGMDYCGVREYVWGDPIKAIHWKLSARRLDGEYYTRLFESVGEPSVDILCGTDYSESDNQTAMSLYDAEVETALSIYEYGITNALHMRIAYGNTRGGSTVLDSIANPTHRDMLDDFPLPRSRTQGSDALPELLLERASLSNEASNLIICTAALSDALIDALAGIDKGSCNVTLIYLYPSSANTEERRDLLMPLRRLEQDNIRCFAFCEASQIEGVSFE